MYSFQPWGLIVALLVAIVIFGPARVIRFSQDIGKRLREFLAEASKTQEEFIKGLSEADKPGDALVPVDESASTNSLPSFGQQLAPHVVELRGRLITAMLAILVAVIAAFVLSDWIIAILKMPAGNIQLYAFSIMDSFFIKWRVALFAGLAFSSPIWLYQVIKFILPGLLEHERRVIIPLLFAACILFALGVIFGYYLLYGMITVLISLFGSQMTYFPSAEAYISFVTFFLLSTGIAFEMPVVLYGLVQMGILSTDLMRRQRKYFYFVMFVFAEIITPVSDPLIAPITIMLPLVLLYEITVFVARIGEKKRVTTAPIPESR